MNRTGQLWIFDMDGTLFQSELVAVAAFHTTLAQLRQMGLEVPDGITDEKILSTFGETHDVIWESLLGYRLDDAHQNLADRMVLSTEVAGLKRGEGALYEGVTDTLRTLKQEGAQLAIASNGQQPYIAGIVKDFGIESLFTGLYSASGYRTASKVDLVRIVLSEIAHDVAYMVGDRSTDVEAGRQNGLTTIGCIFGFADRREVADADHVIRKFAALLDLGI